MKIVKCKWCGREFDGSVTDTGQPVHRARTYCSRECAGISINAARKVYRVTSKQRAEDIAEGRWRPNPHNRWMVEQDPWAAGCLPESVLQNALVEIV